MADKPDACSLPRRAASIQHQSAISGVSLQILRPCVFHLNVAGWDANCRRLGRSMRRHTLCRPQKHLNRYESEYWIKSFLEVFFLPLTSCFSTVYIITRNCAACVWAPGPVSWDLLLLCCTSYGRTSKAKPHVQTTGFVFNTFSLIIADLA